MKYLNIVLCLLMLLFIFVQYNDPDGPMWMVIYSIPAMWALIAAIRPAWLREIPAKFLLPLCLFLSVAAMVYYWPKTPQWWTAEVWWEVETAREGMGMMIVSIVLGVAWITGWRRRSSNDATLADSSI